MKTNEISTSILSGIASYGLLKLSQSKVDPYTRAIIGLTLGVGLQTNEKSTYRQCGLGIGIAGLAQFIEIKNGGKIVSNNFNGIIYTLSETEGISTLQPFEIPSFFIDGLTIKGMNSVFKISVGVYAKISSQGVISETFGAGALVNKFRKAGIKHYDWISEQLDERWVSLYEKSQNL